MARLLPVQQTPPADVSVVQATQRLHREALTTVRGNALAWRNGLAGLLAGLVGFSLLKGQDDVSKLEPAWSVAVGVLLLGALIAGGLGATALLRAAHGRPRLIKKAQVQSGLAADRVEAATALHSLQRGTRLTGLCAALVIAAVATTWYGPTASKPVIEVVTPTGVVCGSVIRVKNGTLTLQTDAGEQQARLADATGLRPADSCGG